MMANGYGCGRNFNFIMVEYHYMHINDVSMVRKDSEKIRKKYVGVVIWPMLAIALGDIYI